MTGAVLGNGVLGSVWCLLAVVHQSVSVGLVSKTWALEGCHTDFHMTSYMGIKSFVDDMKVPE